MYLPYLALVAALAVQPSAIEPKRSGVLVAATFGGARLGPAFNGSLHFVHRDWVFSMRDISVTKVDPACSDRWCEMIASDGESGSVMAGRLFRTTGGFARITVGTGSVEVTRGTKTGRPSFCFLFCSEYSLERRKSRGLAWEAAFHLPGGGSGLLFTVYGNVNHVHSFTAAGLGLSLGHLRKARVPK